MNLILWRTPRSCCSHQVSTNDTKPNRALESYRQYLFRTTEDRIEFVGPVKLLNEATHPRLSNAPPTKDVDSVVGYIVSAPRGIALQQSYRPS